MSTILDVWGEYHRLWKEEGWTQQQIADAKGCDKQVVSRRCKWHEFLPDVAKKAVFDDLLDEGHVEAISGVVFDIEYLCPWLTTQQAQTELTKQILDKHRGSSRGIKPHQKTTPTTIKVGARNSLI